MEVEGDRRVKKLISEMQDVEIGEFYWFSTGFLLVFYWFSTGFLLVFQKTACDKSQY